jgi:hypothetical protein
MIKNKVAHLFIVHVLNNLDDTVMSKKKILSDILLTIYDYINERSFYDLFLVPSFQNNQKLFPNT